MLARSDGRRGFAGDDARVALQRLEREVTLQGAGRAVHRHQRRLDRRRAAAAHRREERISPVPLHSHDAGGRECFLHRRGTGNAAVAALRKRLAGRVKVDDRLILLPVDENSCPAVLAAGVGTSLALLAHPVDLS